MDEQNKKAFDFAADLTKQLITLSTSIVTLTLLFSKDLLGPKWMPVTIWTLFLLSTVCGLWTLMALTGTLAPATMGRPLTNRDKENNPNSASGSAEDSTPLNIGENVRTPSTLQVVTFGLAIAFTLIYVPVAFLRNKPPQTPPSGCACPCLRVPSKPQ